MRRAALIVALIIAGCVPRGPSPLDDLPPARARAVAADLARTRDAALRDDLRTARPPVNVLVLSGGEAHGAYGCGVLAGWRRAASPRPTFDVVTGVSTGALMATFAFLGQPQDDQLLRDVYLNTRDAEVFAGPVGGPPDAVFDTAPLRALIARHVTADTLRRVAAGHAAGRRLYVATVDLDTGALVTWPMSRLAADAVGPGGAVDAAKLDRFRTVLLAAASIPVLFPPVEMDGGLHVDAGLRQAVFLDAAMLPPAASPTVWVIFNGRLGTAAAPVTDDVADVGGRSLSLLTHALEVASVRTVGGVAGSHAPPCPFRWTSEPPTDDPPVAPGLLSPMFDPRQTADRYRAGETAGRSGRWHAGSPTEADLCGGVTPACLPLAGSQCERCATAVVRDAGCSATPQAADERHERSIGLREGRSWG